MLKCLLRPLIAGLGLFLLLAGLSLSSWNSPGLADEVLTLPTEELTVESKRGPQAFVVEVATTDAQRAKGLIYRERMALNAGMLFVFEASGERYFWMKDTPLSLDIIFIDEAGRIVRIAEGTTPFSEKLVPSRGNAKYVLELNAGTARRLGMVAGDVVRAPSIPRPE